MYAQVNNELGKVKESIWSLNTLKLGMVLYPIQLWFLINGASVTDGGFSQTAALYYIIIPLGFLAYSAKNQKVVERITLWRTMWTAVLGFAITMPIVVGVYHFALGMDFGSVGKNEVLGLITIQALFVAPIEEMAFRTLLPNWVDNGPFKGLARYGMLFVTQLGFGVFHWSAYGGNIMGMVIAVTIGCIWLMSYRIKLFGERLGLGFTMGSHCCYNLIISGVLVGNILAVSGV